MKGIEPSYAAWEAAVLPLNYTRGSRDFTLLPDALPEGVMPGFVEPAGLMQCQGVVKGLRKRSCAGHECSGEVNSEVAEFSARFPQIPREPASRHCSPWPMARALTPRRAIHYSPGRKNNFTLREFS